MDTLFTTIPERVMASIQLSAIVILEHVKQVAVGWFEGIVDDTVVKSKESECVQPYLLRPRRPFLYRYAAELLASTIVASFPSSITPPRFSPENTIVYWSSMY